MKIRGERCWISARKKLDERYRDAGFDRELRGEKDKMQKEVPSPRVELGTNRLTEYYSRV